jgi:hypothetical protein
MITPRYLIDSLMSILFCPMQSLGFFLTSVLPFCPNLTWPDLAGTKMAVVFSGAYSRVCAETHDWHVAYILSHDASSFATELAVISTSWSSANACTSMVTSFSSSSSALALSIFANQSSMMRSHKMGPKHDPCGQPRDVSTVIPSEVTLRSCRKSALARPRSPGQPQLASSCTSPGYHAEFKAFLISRAIKTSCFDSALALLRFPTALSIASVVLLPLLKPN